jgi:hypothetical protein
VSASALTPDEQAVSGLISWQAGNMSSVVPYVYDAVLCRCVRGPLPCLTLQAMFSAVQAMVSLAVLSQLCHSRNCSRPVDGKELVLALRNVTYSGITGQCVRIFASYRAWEGGFADSGEINIGNSNYVRATSGLFNMQTDSSTPSRLRSAVQ